MDTVLCRASFGECLTFGTPERRLALFPRRHTAPEANRNPAKVRGQGSVFTQHGKESPLKRIARLFPLGQDQQPWGPNPHFSRPNDHESTVQ
ncbi:MAG: hypothetical protein ACPG42_06400 [Alphaproteobacteria bacterium]|jgi:hypothetical protein